MKKYIVTTSIYPPSKALRLYSEMQDWQLIVVGDLKTPHDQYNTLNCLYLHPEEQKSKYPELSDNLGWCNIQRRNIGFVEAYNLGADIVATVDDDNIPYSDWGSNIAVGREIEVDLYESENGFFDPLSVTETKSLWHRGYPIQLVSTKNQIESLGKYKRKVLVQADFWDGDPDVDAIARITQKPEVKYRFKENFGSDQLAPFNSQNTFISRDLFPHYSVLPHVGRMDDIWGGYIAQHHFPRSVIYGPASVYQERNDQDLVTNMEDEIFGYRTTLKLLEDISNYENYLPEKTRDFLEVYRDCFR